jgi:hypothetical protein
MVFVLVGLAVAVPKSDGDKIMFFFLLQPMINIASIAVITSIAVHTLFILLYTSKKFCCLLLSVCGNMPAALYSPGILPQILLYLQAVAFKFALPQPFGIFHPSLSPDHVI